MTSLRDAAAGRKPAIAIELVPLQSDERLWLATILPSTANARVGASIESGAARWMLTRRQKQVLALVMRGLTNAAIATELQCVQRTVELHVTALLDRIGVDNRAALVATVLSLS